MRFTAVLVTLASLAIGTSAQAVHIISPAANTNFTPGQTFTATVAFQDTTSSVDVLALVFGLKGNNGGPDDLGQAKLGAVFEPTFDGRGPQGQFIHNVTLTIPAAPIEGTNRFYNLTSGEFFTLGATQTPSTFVDQVPIFITSA